MSDDPHSTVAWAYGANGERALGNLLDPLRDEGLAVLHDRRIPGSKANIDHVVIAPWGVFVVDAKVGQCAAIHQLRLDRTRPLTREMLQRSPVQASIRTITR